MADLLAAAAIEWLDRLYIAAAGAGVRQEERKKAREVAGILGELGRAVAAVSRRRPLLVVDAAAGKAYVGLLAAPLVLGPAGRQARVHLIERSAAAVEASRRAVALLGAHAAGVAFTWAAGDVGDSALWPDEPDVVVALHACGEASDLIIDRAVAARARHVLVAPCCTSDAVPAARRARARADLLGIPPQAGVRRRFIEALVDAERTLRLEAAGWETVVVPFVAPTVTPHNLLFRARRVGEPGRMRAAAERLDRLNGTR